MLYVVILVVLAAIDQITKQAMYQAAHGQIGFSIPIIKNFFNLTYVENHGGIFGLFQGKINLFTIGSLILIGYIVATEIKNFKNYTKFVSKIY